MFRTQNCSSRRAARQEGFTLAALIVILTIISIIVAFTVPEQWSLVMKRERDRQTIFLMKQYARGIRNFQQKNGNALPSSLDQLRDARNPRLLRGNGKWRCPITGKEDGWILVPQQAVQQPGTMPPIPPQGDIIGGNIPAGTNTNPGTTTGSQLNPDASPEDYVGFFVAVRPKAKGKSFIAFNGAESYEQWVYTVQDLNAEIQAKMMAMSTPQ